MLKLIMALLGMSPISARSYHFNFSQPIKYEYYEKNSQCKCIDYLIATRFCHAAKCARQSSGLQGCSGRKS